MADAHPGQEAGSCETEVVGPDSAGEEALLKSEAAEEKKADAPLPKLSAAEFRVYNAMAEHMEYFVRYFCSFCRDFKSVVCVLLH